ncbi:MAG: DNA replication protein DnaC [Clostridium sp.]|nr:DNA replication protein DnaC [Clostridium sp.]
MISGYQSKILAMYDSIRDEEAKKLKERIAEIEKKYPEIIDIDNKVKQLSLQMSLAILRSNDGNKTLEEYKNKIMDLRAQKYEMLVSKGYDTEYLNLHYRCNKCKDTGYIRGNIKCSCYKPKLISLYYDNSSLKDIVKEKNFSKFNLSLFSTHRGEEKYSPRKNMENICGYIINNYIKDFDSIDTNLLFYGSPGSGKSYLSYCIAKELLDLGHLVVYKTSDELINDLREVRFNNNSNLEDLLVNCDLLIIDDLGAEQRNDFSTTEFFNLLNKKLLHKKKMLISTNISLGYFSKLYSERIYSRLIGDFKLFKFYSEDIRIELNLKKMKNN